MDISSVKYSAGLLASVAPSSTNASGSISLGSLTNNIAITGCDTFYSVRAKIVSGDAFVIDIKDNDTTGSTAWVAGTAQIETATAAGTVSASGNASVVVTAAGMTGSPKTIAVAVTNGDTAATWASKVRTALAADTAVSALFTVGGTTTAISLTRKANAVGFFPANDSTLNIALSTGTASGITTAATSANTTAGVASDGTLITDGDGKDFEGNTIATVATIEAVQITVNAGTLTFTNTDEIGELTSGEKRIYANANGIPSALAPFTFTATADCDITIDVAGTTA
jgi:hypothetical protein